MKTYWCIFVLILFLKLPTKWHIIIPQTVTVWYKWWKSSSACDHTNSHIDQRFNSLYWVFTNGQTYFKGMQYFFTKICQPRKITKAYLNWCQKAVFQKTGIIVNIRMGCCTQMMIIIFRLIWFLTSNHSNPTIVRQFLIRWFCLTAMCWSLFFLLVYIHFLIDLRNARIVLF